MTAAWTAGELDRIGGALRADTPIWVVRVGDELYVRSFRGPDGAWFRTAQQQQRGGHVRAGGIDKDVAFVDAGPEVADAVDAAYRDKYARYPSYVSPMVSEQARATTTSTFAAASVRFTPGARTGWHTDPHGQTIFVIEGVGLCQREGGPIEEIHPGDRVFFEPGENHWHGAAPETPSWSTSPCSRTTRPAVRSPGASTSPTSVQRRPRGELTMSIVIVGAWPHLGVGMLKRRSRGEARRRAAMRQRARPTRGGQPAAAAVTRTGTTPKRPSTGSVRSILHF